jgi:hypothetical protein
MNHAAGGATIIKLRRVVLPILGRTFDISFRSFATVCELAVEFGVLFDLIFNNRAYSRLMYPY